MGHEYGQLSLITTQVHSSILCGDDTTFYLSHDYKNKWSYHFSVGSFVSAPFTGKCWWLQLFRLHCCYTMYVWLSLCYVKVISSSSRKTRSFWNIFPNEIPSQNLQTHPLERTKSEGLREEFTLLTSVSRIKPFVSFFFLLLLYPFQTV